MADDSRQSPTRNNDLKHGAFRYLATGELPADLTGLDVEVAGELGRLIGDDDGRHRLMCITAARSFVVSELLYRFFVKEHKEHPDVLPGSLKVFGSYQESMRRQLAELQLTPASASKKDKDVEPVSAKEILDSLTKSRENEPSDTTD